MDFTNHIPSDLLRHYILQLDRNIHNIIMCRSVSKLLKSIIDEIIKSFKFSSSVKLMKSLNNFITPICGGRRVIRIKIRDPSTGIVVNTYHYIVNNKYTCNYNYHLANQHGGESLRLICYDGLLINIFRESDAAVIIVGGSHSCQYTIAGHGSDSYDISFLLDSPIAKYEQKILTLY